ncbi:MAG: hypothetical protein V4662_27050 [Verrucomicrobiota bacterium]
MTTIRHLHLIASIFLVGSASAQPAVPPPPYEMEQRTSRLWLRLVSIAEAAQHGPRERMDPEDPSVYETHHARLSLAAQRYAKLDRSGAAPLLAAHVQECAAAHREMAQAMRRAGHELVPALQALLPDLRQSPRAHVMAEEGGFDLSAAGINEETLGFIAALAGDTQLSGESRYISVQCGLISAAAAAFAQSEQRLRDAQAAHEKVALALRIEYGPDVVAKAGQPVALWTW